VIATIMEPVIKALDYFHRSGNIHRDIKAGNILIDDHGNVKLADYGVATSGFDSFNFGKNAHQTFVGTPCWCAAHEPACRYHPGAGTRRSGWRPR
jgi:serine/threonine-protein kinase OSR1/STK39